VNDNQQPQPEAGSPAASPAENTAESPAETVAEAPAEAPAETAAETAGETVAETPAETAGEAPAETTAEMAGETTAETPAKKPARRGRAAAVAGALLLVGALVAGVGYTVVTVRGADRDPGEPVWAFPEHVAEKAEPARTTGLAGMLVPYDDTWEPGPDLPGFGSEARLSGERAAALRKEALRDLPRTQRKRLEKEIDRQRVQGMAMRSYVSVSTDEWFTDKSAAVSVVLTQMEDTAAVRSISRFQSEFLEALDVLREGPAVRGHKNARCFLPPKGEVKKGELDAMFCSAYEGDVLVTVTASGPAQLNADDVADLLADQLDRIEEPGKSV
jgi:hypothetical protein